MKSYSTPGFRPNPLAPAGKPPIPATPVAPSAVQGPRQLLVQLGVATPQGTVFGRVHPNLGAPGFECLMFRTRNGEPGAVPIDTRVFLDERAATEYLRGFCAIHELAGTIERNADGLDMLRALNGAIGRRARARARANNAR